MRESIVEMLVLRLSLLVVIPVEIVSLLGISPSNILKLLVNNATSSAKGW